MIEITFHDVGFSSSLYRYRVRLTNGDWLDWAYPSATARQDAVVLMRLATNEYGEPPSQELRTLIEAGAPWYVVLDKLAEEYPQWSEHFDRATAVQYAGEVTG